MTHLPLMRRGRGRAVTLLVAGVVLALLVPVARATTPTEQVASTTATAVPDVATGWLPVDYVPHPLNPVGELPGPRSDWQFPTVLRVDVLPLSQRVYDDRFYLWTWLHGLSPRTPDNGGRMRLHTADSLEGPWTDRGFVTPRESLAPPGWSLYGWTAGDVVWSDRHRRFFSVPKSCPVGRPGCDGFLMESVDGVHWELSDTSQPILESTPGTWDHQETGYGRLLRIAGPGGAERWIWLYRGNEAAKPERYYRFGIATANDIYGPWTKAGFNPAFDPKSGGVLEDEGTYDQFSEGADEPFNYTVMNPRAFLCHDGWFQILWQDVVGTSRLSRSKDLQHWETFAHGGAGDVNPLGEQGGAPVSPSAPGANLIFDDTVGTWTVLYLGNGFATSDNSLPGGFVNIARSVSGGTAPSAEPSDACPQIVAPSALQLVSPAEVESTDAFELSATLTSKDEPVEGAAVEFEVGGLVAWATTDGNGVVTVSLNADLDPGEHQVRVSFGGDDTRWPSSATAVLRVVKDPTVLDYTGTTTARGEQVDVEAVLSDDDGNPLAGQAVGFTISGNTVWATTDALGRAATTVSVPDHGRSQPVDVHYGGATRYRPATTSATITWGAAPT